MALFDSTYADLRRLLGIGSGMNNNYFSGLTNIGRQDLDSPEGYGGAYALWLANLDRLSPGLGRQLRGQLGNVANRYRVAAAADPMLSFTNFLSGFGTQEASRMAGGLSNFERGLNPRAYTGRYRLLRA